MIDLHNHPAKKLFCSDPAVLRRGGVVPKDAGPCRQGFDQLVQRAYQIVGRFTTQDRIDRLYIDFVGRKNPGAFAFSRSGFDFLAIHSGYVEMMWLYNVLMSSPTTLPRIGNSALEVAHTRLDLMNPRSAPKSTFRRPFEPIRAAYAEHLCMYAFDFLIAHELAHLLHGHLTFIEAKRPLDPLISHALENDADHFAVNTILSEAVGFVQQPDLAADLASIYQHPVRGMFVPMFAVAVLYRLQWLDDMVFWHLDKPEISHPSHPPMQIRSLSLFSAANLRIRTDIFLPVIRRSANRITTMAGLHAEFALQKVRMKPIAVPDGFRAVGNPKSYEYMDRVNRRWEEIRPELQRFSALKLPEIQQVQSR